ncbi:MAG: AAA family ATPase [Oribacterium sp.]|nr:AAA family ATPase [Oribacterium sp.]
MRLIDLHIEGFGKFHDLDLRFAEGMNILYGHNEAGKSTLHAFLQAMLYGLERRPGIGSAAKLHKKYRPWDAPERFGGTLRLAHEGSIYRIVRDFNADDLSADGAATTTAGGAGLTGGAGAGYGAAAMPGTGAAGMTGDTGTVMTGAAAMASGGRTSGAAAPAAGADACSLEIWDETAGVRVPDPRGFLQAMLGGISETAFENTVSIGQLRSATSRSMVHELKSYITNLSTTGDMSLDSAGALKLLRQQRSALEAKRVPEAAKSYAQLIGEIRNIEREIAQPEYENQLRKYQALRSEVRTEQVDRQTRREELLQKTAAQEAVLTQAGFDCGDDILDAKEHADMLYSLCQIGAEPRERVIRIALPLLFGLLTILCGLVAVLITAIESPAFAQRFKLAPEKVPGLVAAVSGSGLSATILVATSIGLLVLCMLLFVWRLYANAARTGFLRETAAELSAMLTKQIGTAEISDAAMESFRTHMDELLRAEEELETQRTTLAEVSAELQNLSNDERRYDVELQKQNEKQTELEGKLQHLANVKNRAEMLKRTLDENDAISTEIDAINLAAETMTELQSSIQSSFGHYLNKEAGELIAGITGGVYDSMWIDQNLDIFMNTPGKIVPIEDVSSGTMDQIYLALRLAAARLIQGDTGAGAAASGACASTGAASTQTSAADGSAGAAEARLPLIFDDSFAMYDEQRLASALQYITEIHHGQILLFTCHTREQRILESENVNFNLIEM